MNTLARLDAYLSIKVTPPTPPTPSKALEKVPDDPPTHPRISNLPPTPRKKRPSSKRRATPKPTSTSIQLPPPSTPFLLRIALTLWAILLSFWRSLVGETRAERVRRRKKRGRSGLSGIAGVIGLSSDEGSASELEPITGEIGGDGEPWVDPVTRAPVEESQLDEPELFAPPIVESHGPDSSFTFRLRSAESKVSPKVEIEDAPVQQSKTYNRQPTPPSILSNPLPSPRRQARLLPNPMSTSLLDPSVPASQTLMSSTASAPTSKPHSHPPRPHQTPFHLQKTLILDLDETLIHSTSRPLSYAASAGGGLLGLSFGGLLGGRKARREGHTVEVVIHGRSTTYHVYKRPYVDQFLKKVASWYTLVIFTASMPEYADPVIDWLDGGRGFFAKRLYRESCHLQSNGSYIKDLALVEADLARVCFMDNSPISYSWNKANALPIEGWTSDPYDEALLQSIPVLDSLRFVNDVRRILGIRGFS